MLDGEVLDGLSLQTLDVGYSKKIRRRNPIKYLFNIMYDASYHNHSSLEGVSVARRWISRRLGLNE